MDSDSQPSVDFTSKDGITYTINSDDQADQMIQNYQNAAAHDQAEINSNASTMEEIKTAKGGYNAAEYDINGVEAAKTKLDSELAASMVAGDAAQQPINAATVAAAAAPAPDPTPAPTPAAPPAAVATPAPSTDDTSSSSYLGTASNIPTATTTTTDGVTTVTASGAVSPASSDGSTGLPTATTTTVDGVTTVTVTPTTTTDPSTATGSTDPSTDASGTTTPTTVAGTDSTPTAISSSTPSVNTSQTGGVSAAPSATTAVSNGPEIYTVKHGDTMTAIAEQHGVSLASLEAANKSISNPSLIYPGEKVTIPTGASTGVVTDSVSSVYTVQAGDTLSGIAQKEGVTLGGVEAANKSITDPSKIFPAEKINIPIAGSSHTAK